ncbi:MAG: c-type cytochrome [Vicinamibacterales bacterium]
MTRHARACAIAALTCLAAVAPSAGHAQAPAAPLPDGPGRAIVEARCLVCHDADIIAGQRLSEAGWGRELDKMIRWGARVPDSDRATLVAYLSAHFAPAPAVSHESAGGEAVFQRACGTCHGEDIVAGQRLSEAGWTREVDKMVRWGARVDAAETAALARYLATRFPPRR